MDHQLKMDGRQESNSESFMRRIGGNLMEFLVLQEILGLLQVRNVKSQERPIRLPNDSVVPLDHNPSIQMPKLPVI
jgi:hypothetical protein